MARFYEWGMSCRPVQWCAKFRAACWLWRHRWPLFPLSAVVLMTILWTAITDPAVPGTHPFTDLVLVTIVVVELLVMLTVLVSKTTGWDDRTSGLLLFVLADFTLYGLLILPPFYGFKPLYAEFATNFLRWNLAIGPPIIILAYFDYFNSIFRLWYRTRVRHTLRQRLNRDRADETQSVASSRRRAWFFRSRE